MSIYVVDTSVFRHILWHVYRSVVPEIWDGLEHMLLAGHVISVKEAYRELELQFAQDRLVSIGLSNLSELSQTD